MHAFIECIQDGTARVLFGDDESVAIQVPEHRLPRGAREGMVLRVKFAIDEAATNQRKVKERG